MSKSIREQFEQIPEDERLEVKMRAQSIRHGIYDSAPHFCVQPYDHLIGDICISATFDDWEKKRVLNNYATLADVKHMLEGHADRLDVKAMNQNNDIDVIATRKQESDVREIARVVETMSENDFNITGYIDLSPRL